MRLSGSHILFVCLVVLTLVSGCARRGRVIPAGTFARIYADMLVADQWLSDNNRVRRTADTTNFYAPVFAKYGYSFKDYDRSVNYYLDNPGKYARLLENTTALLEKRIAELKAEEARIEEIEKLLEYLKENALPLIDFELDTLLWRPDTLASRDSLALADSLSLADSLAVADSSALADSLAATDSLALADSLAAADGLAPADPLAADYAVIAGHDRQTPEKLKLKPDNVKRRNSLRPDSLKAPGKFSRNKPSAD